MPIYRRSVKKVVKMDNNFVICILKIWSWWRYCFIYNKINLVLKKLVFQLKN